jgi:hypothetical protein
MLSIEKVFGYAKITCILRLHMQYYRGCFLLCSLNLRQKGGKTDERKNFFDFGVLARFGFDFGR